VLFNFKSDAFLPSGAPSYDLDAATKSAVAISSETNAESVRDRFGRFLVNTSPMRAFAPDGKVAWTFQNQWVGVHGSHNAPLPETGVMQGVLYFLGTAPLDDKAEVTVMNGNHGRFFVMTTDGMYLDEMFKDVRVTQQVDAYLIGGECFGGFFAKSDKDGNYYLQSGHTDYRIFRIDGLQQLKRGEGTFSVSATQVAAAQAAIERRAAKTDDGPKVAQVAEAQAKAIKLTEDPERWSAPWTASWGDPKGGNFARVKAVRAGDRLVLGYQVRDNSPWANNGGDKTQLFKTGDSVDFQFSTDPAAKPNRAGPVPGDRRLLVGPMGDKNVAILYCHREKDPSKAKPVQFSSPWRAEKVDRVEQLDSAQITVKTNGNGYWVTVSVPLADLGLPSGAATLMGDFGVIYGDPAGSMNLLRSYWSNKATNLVNDVPGEIMLSPKLWGTLQFSAGGNEK
jgi:hypothetical protein